MPKANRVHSTPRKRASKTKPEQSAIIEQCVIYLQSKAAFVARFEGDATEDSNFAGSGKKSFGRDYFERADRAVQKLVDLSSAQSPLIFEEVPSGVP